ncbi:HAD-IA family hydrolase [Aestuariimicrobium kwangyangense]|uniref:HAD-IA family hydrolase n=1 Tax=Aestuariimicrobium kwangyangense TaxID=396389 RepID=UPI0003B3E87B|nr:HAD-IA family hydrolase [Aestuariimicrobium kwangyangense]
MTELGALADRTFSAVIFDMDGTLIDSTPAVERSWRIWAAEFGLDVDDLASAHGIPAETTARRLVRADRVDEAVARINEIELDDLDGVTLLPGAQEALDALTDDRRAIATSCTRPLFEARIAAAGFPRPGIIVTADDIEHGKPHPDPFLRGAELLGFDPRECLVFEDAPGGVAAARAAGCPVIGLTTTSGPEGLAEADAIIGSLADIRLVQTQEGIRLQPA